MKNLALDELISEPREALDVEVKSWLNLTDNDHRAMVAKEIIALANHGGGYLVVGFDEFDDGSFRPSSERPANLAAWSQDAVQSIVTKYVDPAVQCRVVHQGPDGAKHPIIVVPGGHRVPVRSRAGSPDGKLQAHRIYIRRAGPASEEPKTAEEWDRFFERCMQNRRAELLDAMRSILSGVIPSSDGSTPPDSALDAFVAAADARWHARVAPLATDAPPRLPHGFYDFAAAIEGDFTPCSLSDLRTLILQSLRNHSGWPAFVALSRAPFAPTAVDGAVEFWKGPDLDGSFDLPAHHDFWRISPDGLLFTRRGYPEDGGHKGIPPATSFDITTPPWRIGEAILQTTYLARALGLEDADLTFRISYSRLAGRQLVSAGNPRRWIFEGRSAAQDTYEASQTVSLAALPASLPEVVHAMLAPLYELFDFFALPKRLVEEELADLQKHNF